MSRQGGREDSVLELASKTVEEEEAKGRRDKDWSHPKTGKNSAGGRGAQGQRQNMMELMG